jgi:phenylpropionate dioxygenase-like ring-hydroxylating dioxygenase large terminal subunit
VSAEKPDGYARYTGLRRVEPTLPSRFYVDGDHHQLELRTIWYRSWIYLCRADALAGPRAFRTFEIGDQSILLLRDGAGELRAFHNTCRHRGSILCTAPEGRLASDHVICPYHRWSYDLAGGLVRAPNFTPSADFKLDDYPLYGVAVRSWRGFVFVNLSSGEDDRFEAMFDPAAATLDRWPLEALTLAHTYRRVLSCNWKIFWENYNECLHCPSVHAELSRLVPIYGRAMMAEHDDPEWASHRDSADPRYRGGLRNGAVTWSVDGMAHGPEFPDLSEAERRAGFTYLTLLPSAFIVGHADHVRLVSLKPLGVEKTELTAQWLVSPEALAGPGFDLSNIVDFAARVLDEDGSVCELNQRGLRSIRHESGRLMPPEYELHRFHEWVRRRLDGA